MKKRTKRIVGVCIMTACIVILSAALFMLWWDGAFNKINVRDVASFESPDGNYVLVFQQLGHPEWPFGKTEVRLTLKNQNGEKLSRFDTELQDDGANAGIGNIQSIEWTDDSVIVTLQASEMPDKRIELKVQE